MLRGTGLWAVGLAVILLADVAWLILSKPPQSPTLLSECPQTPAALLPASALDSRFLFRSAHCPHCRAVDDFIQKHGGDDVAHIIHKDVSALSCNDRTLLLRIVKRCHLSPQEIEVPLLWDGKNCIVGDQEVIRALKKTMP